jgi:divalent metal cation (Fe/Co/Zn/Cd) transporter
MHFGPEMVHVDLELAVDPRLSAGELVDTLHALEAKVHEAHPIVRKISVRLV